MILPSGCTATLKARSVELLLSTVVATPPERKVGSRAPAESRQRSSRASRRGRWDSGRRAGAADWDFRRARNHMVKVSFGGCGLRLSWLAEQSRRADRALGRAVVGMCP